MNYNTKEKVNTWVFWLILISIWAMFIYNGAHSKQVITEEGVEQDDSWR